MAVIWGIHNHQALNVVEGGFISVGWEELGDLREVGSDRTRLKELLSAQYPAAKPGAIPVWAGVLARFIGEMQVGDYVISPNKVDRTLHFGRVEGDFFVEPNAEVHPNRRPVKWLKLDIPRGTFSKSALHEIGSAITLFRVKTHADEFLGFLENGEVQTLPVDADADADEVELAEDEPNAARVDTYARDFVVEILKGLGTYQFEKFVAALLTAAGYRATATVATGDGGIDVIASKDALAIEPPIIKVQCKRTIATIGSPDVQRLTGALAPGGSELGLFVTLGNYSSDAQHLERTRQDLRLLNGSQLVELIFEYYEALTSEWKGLLPLKRVYAVDRGAETV